MKRNLLVVSFIVLVFNLGSAQSKFRIGFLAGINYAGCSDISSIKISPKVAFLVGLSSEIKAVNKLFITADLYFERKRAESGVFGQDMISGRDLYYISQNDYLVLPVKVKYEFKKMDSFYLTGGFYSAYLVNSYFYDGFDGNTSSDKFKKLDFGLCALE